MFAKAGSVLKSFTVASVLIAALALSALAQLPTVKVVNNTGYTVYVLQMTPSTDDDWGRDLLGEETILSNGHSFDVRLPQPLSAADRYDIRLIDEDMDTYTKMNVLIAENTVIEFKIEDIDGD
jgi:hypothetical protein